MQTKSISNVIRTKINEWIESVTDTQLREDLKKHVLVSGGSIASLYLGEPVNDYDVYLTDRPTLLTLVEYYAKPFSGSVEVLDGAKRQSYIDQYREGFTMEEFLNKPGHRAGALRNLKDDQIKLYINSGGGYKNDNLKLIPETTEPVKYQPVYFSPNAISLTGDLQIVIRFWGTPDEIHKTFDFVHATNYFTLNKGVVVNSLALESLLTKQLKYQGSYYPVTSIIRTKKFVKRGFNITAGEIFKMIFQSSMLDLQNMDVLEEQLIGVDVAYFETLINALRDRQENEPGFTITPEYVNELIDRIFNKHVEED